MTRINLYPWRLEKEEQSKTKFLLLLAITNIAVIIFMVCCNWYYSNQIDNQTTNNEYINKQVIEANRRLREISTIKAQKEAILARLEVLQKLDRDRYSTINILNEMVELINPLVVLDKISRKGTSISITGYSENNAGVARFLRAIELSPNFDSAELKQIKALDKNYSDSNFQNFFELTFFQKNKFSDSVTVESESESKSAQDQDNV